MRRTTRLAWVYSNRCYIPMNKSATAHLALRLNNQEFSLHVGMNITPERDLARFANSCRWIWTGLLLEGQGHRLPRINMISPEPLALRTSDLYPFAFPVDDTILKQWRADPVSHRALVQDNDPGQGAGCRVPLHTVSIVLDGDLHLYLILGLEDRRIADTDSSESHRSHCYWDH